MGRKFCLYLLLFAAAVLAGFAAPSDAQQRTVLEQDNSAPRRTRLILKDGSYQLVMSYKVVGDRVRYVSAERGGVEEEIPLALVDFDATKKWERDHTQPAEGDGPQAGAPPIDPELLKEEADRAAQTPEVSPDLRLPDQDSVLALDTFRGQPQLVPLAQSDGELNRNTAHNVLKAVVNPLSSSHQLVQLKGERSLVQIHVEQPVLYIRIAEPASSRSGTTPITVDTHGASEAMNDKHPLNPANSRYVIVRADVRQGARVVASFKISALGSSKLDEDIIETTSEVLPGGYWMRLTPKASLLFGEYALMEVLSDREVNLGVWDFGIHPTAPANRDAILPQPRRSVGLTHRGQPQ